MKFKAVFAKRETDHSVPLTELKQGQIGQITADNDPLSDKDCVGRFVQWSAGDENGGGTCLLREVGRANWWSAVRLDDPKTQKGYRVRILGEGDKLAVGKDGRIGVEWAPHDDTVPMSALRVGEIGEVNAPAGYKGQLVTRVYRDYCEGAVQFLGGEGAWRPENALHSETLRVRVLKPGDRIEVAGDGVEGAEG